MTRNSFEQRQNISHAVMKSKSASFHRPILSLMSLITHHFVFNTHQGDQDTESNPQPSSYVKDAHDITGGNESHHRGVFDDMLLSHGTSLPPSWDRATTSNIKDDRFVVNDRISLKTSCKIKNNFSRRRKCLVVFNRMGEGVRNRLPGAEVADESDHHQERLVDINLK